MDIEAFRYVPIGSLGLACITAVAAARAVTSLVRQGVVTSRAALVLVVLVFLNVGSVTRFKVLQPSSTQGYAVIITGASRGIGQSAALRLESLGYTVFAGVRKATDGEALVSLAAAARPPGCRPARLRLACLARGSLSSKFRCP